MLTTLGQIINEAEQHQVQVTLLLIPHCSQVSERYADKYRKMGAVLPDRISSDMSYPFSTQLQHHFRNNTSVRIIDPLNEMRSMENRGTALYYNNDEHLNSTGQEWLANYLKQVLFR
jgi:hypothetical protein